MITNWCKGYVPSGQSGVDMCKGYGTTGWPSFKPTCAKGLRAGIWCHVAPDNNKEVQA